MLLAVCGRVDGAVLQPSHVAVCETLLTSRHTLLFVTGRGSRHDDAPAGVHGGSEAGALLRNCGTTARPWTIATARRGQRINVTVVDLARAPHATDPSAAATAAAASTSASDDRCRRYALFTEPEAVSSRYRCDEDARRRLSSLGETILYASQTGRVQMVLSSQSTASDKFLLIFTGMEIIRIHPGGPKSRQPRVDAVN